MDARSAPSPDRARSRLRWLVQGGLFLAAALLVWAVGRAVGLWPQPAPTGSQTVPLAASPVPQDVPSLGRVDRAAPQAGATEIARLYLPAIAVRSVAGVPAVQPQAAAARPTSPGFVPPLQLSDPRFDVPRSAVRARSLDDTPTASAAEAPSLPAAGVGGPVVSVEAALPDTLSGDRTGRWIWPVHGDISQFFSERHRAIDIVSEHGDVVVAADRGEVVYAEWEISGFGYLVVVDHGDGYRTYYGHLYGFYVDVGQVVERGDLLGQLGNTGNSSGPHLHFEIRHLGIARDPLKLLPPG